jgi:hypothetical protein
MRKILFGLLALTCSLVFGQDEAREARKARDIVREAIESFELNYEVQAIGFQDYVNARKLLKQILEKRQQSTLIQDTLNAINRNLHDDLSLVKSLKSTKKTAAVRKILKDANERLKNKAKDMTPEYHSALLAFMFNDDTTAANMCITELCVESIRRDILQVTRILTKANKSLDLGFTKLNKIPSKTIKRYKNYQDYGIKRISERMPYLALHQGSVEMENLRDVSLLDLTKYGPLNVARKGLDQSIEELEELKEEEERTANIIQYAIDGTLFKNCYVKPNVFGNGELFHQLYIKNHFSGNFRVYSETEQNKLKNVLLEIGRNGKCR